VNPTSLKSLRILLFGGEKVSFPHVQKGIDILGSGKMIHVYGPTETTVYATYYPVDYMRKDGYVPIGKPLANTQLFVLDEKMKPVPTGVAGELYIGGDGVALGYINNPELTSIKFLKNRFSSEENSRLYRTGDLVKWLHDGNIEYLGRTDNQVKVRGYRIELNEIENVLQESGLVKQAVVLVKEDANGNTRLIGYVVAEELDKQSIINFLSGKLPRYMIPDAWIKADSIPLNSNGKIDKTSLADSYTVELISNEYVAPSSETENKLAEIWQNILKVRKVGVHDEFFELGGSSLLAVRLVSAIRKEFKIDLAIRDVFEYTSVGALAKYIEIKLNNYEEVEDPTETELLII
ncbi:MAG: amino acid adenylation protein, partial [Segetibacter sp.]|nr:amino acid adenylation protein [Segetibacter sp.]